MKVLIVFASVEGQTAKIARFIEGEVQKAGHEAALFDAGDTKASISFEGVDKVILAAPVHERRHPEGFEVLLAGRQRDLQALDTLLLSVSLSAAFPEGLEEAAEYVTELKMRTGFTPDAELLVAGAVRASSYDYFASQVVRHVVLRGREADPAEEHEFTDWDAVASGVAEFMADGGAA
jgi:menaquinone-dependent protoporphyrinogen oxidase